MEHSRYYYDYTRNMSHEDSKAHCGRPNCIKEECVCMTGMETLKGTKIVSYREKQENENWTTWVGEMEDQDQPACNIDNQEDCENCGS